MRLKGRRGESTEREVSRGRSSGSAAKDRTRKRVKTPANLGDAMPQKFMQMELPLEDRGEASNVERSAKRRWRRAETSAQERAG